MSYLPNNPYGPTVPMMPPQLGLGGQAPMQAPLQAPMMPPGMNPLAGLPTAGAGFPGAGLPGMPTAGIPGMGQDAFSQSAGAGTPATAPTSADGQFGSVFQHQSGGFADKNAGLPNGSYWKSWKGITAITAGVLSAAYIGIGVAFGKWNPLTYLSSAAPKYGDKALHSITDETLKGNVAKLARKAETAYTNFTTEGLTKANVAERHTTFGKTFDEVDFDKLRAEVTESDYKAAEALKTAYLKQADEVKKAVEADSPLDSQAIKDLQAETDKAIKAYEKKLEVPPAEGATTVVTYGNNALHSIADDTLKGNVAKLAGTAKTAYTTFTEGLTKENVASKHEAFGKTFDEVVSDKLQKEVTEGDYKAAEALKTAYLNQAEAVKKAAAEGKPLDSKEIKNLETETEKAIKAYEEKLKAPPAGGAAATS